MSDCLVNRCICHEHSFEEIKEYAKEKGYTDLEDLQIDNYCSNGCRICAPYVEMVLAFMVFVIGIRTDCLRMVIADIIPAKENMERIFPETQA